MCGACDRQERVCPRGHVSPKRHGDVFGPPSWLLCPTCGERTTIRPTTGGQSAQDAARIIIRDTGA